MITAILNEYLEQRLKAKWNPLIWLAKKKKHYSEENIKHLPIG